MLRSRLLVRLILVVTTIQAIIFGILVWNGVRLLDTSHAELWQRAVKEHSTLLAQALVAAGPALKDPLALHRTLELLKNNPSLRYAAVFNTQRELLVSVGESPPPLAQNSTDNSRYRYIANDSLISIEQPIILNGRTLGIVQLGYSDKAVSGILSTAGIQNATLVLLGLLLSATCILAMSQSVDRGLSRLKAGINALQQEDLEHIITTDLMDATGDIAYAVNALAAHLQANRLELRGQHEQQLRQEARRLNNLLRGINAVVWEVDPDKGQFRYVSDEAESLLGYPVKEWLEPDFCQRLIHPSDLDWVRGFLTHTCMATDNFNLDFRIYNKDNVLRWLRMISFLEIRGQGMVLTGLLLDVTEEKLNEQEIVYLANNDPLTGLINRRRFQERLEEQLAYNRRYNVSGALLFLDLDHFKYINDTYGHHTGDEYLHQVANHLRANLRETDIIGRLGGDEFGIILPNIGSLVICVAGYRLYALDN